MKEVIEMEVFGMYEYSLLDEYRCLYWLEWW